jgi:hypothetical protein
MHLVVATHVLQQGPALTLTCSLDCVYTARLYRGSKLLDGVRGRAIGARPKRLSLRVPPAKASYRLFVAATNPVNPGPPKAQFVRLRPG